jgi:monoamine oxidase
MNNKSKLLIIGGGISGLVAARSLAADFDVLLLEASPRYGGRINTIEGSGSTGHIEGGAEFVHGDAFETMKLLKEAGLNLEEMKGVHYKFSKDSLSPETGMIDGFDSLLNKMSLLEEDETLSSFLRTNYFAVEDVDLKQQIVEFAEGFDLADPDHVSVKSLYNEWSNNGVDNRIKQGYGALISFLVEDCKKLGCILINDVHVTQIDWSAGKVKLTSISGHTYEGECVLITVPLGQLQNLDALRITPQIPAYNRQFENMGFGTVIKIVLEFKEIFWNAEAGFIFSKETIPTWWTQLPNQQAVLTGWKGGPGAFELSSLSDDQLLESGLNSLSKIFNRDVGQLKDLLVSGHVFNWQKQSFTHGAYSYSFPETPSALKVLKQPIQRTLFFAGECFYEGVHPGTVDAAVVSALEVSKLLKSIFAGQDTNK